MIGTLSGELLPEEIATTRFYQGRHGTHTGHKGDGRTHSPPGHAPPRTTTAGINIADATGNAAS